MSWKKIIKVDLTEAKKLTEQYLPEENRLTFEEKMKQKLKNSKERHKRREENKKLVLDRISNHISYLKSLGKFPQKKSYMREYRRLERKVRLSKPWTYNTEHPNDDGQKRVRDTFDKDPYIYFLLTIKEKLEEMSSDVKFWYAAHMA